MLQLLLAVINSNLTKILNQESFYTMTKKEMKLEMKKKQEGFKPDDEINKEEKDKDQEMDEAQKKAIKDLAKVLRMARAAKAEAQRKIEEEAKKKEAM